MVLFTFEIIFKFLLSNDILCLTRYVFDPYSRFIHCICLMLSFLFFFAFCVSFWFVMVNLTFFQRVCTRLCAPLIHAILIRSLFAFYTLHLLHFVSWISCWLVVVGEYPRKLSVYAPVYAFDCTLLLIRFLFVPHSIFLYVAFFNMELFFLIFLLLVLRSQRCNFPITHVLISAFD